MLFIVSVTSIDNHHSLDTVIKVDFMVANLPAETVVLKKMIGCSLKKKD